MQDSEKQWGAGGSGCHAAVRSEDREPERGAGEAEGPPVVWAGFSGEDRGWMGSVRG